MTVERADVMFYKALAADSKMATDPPVSEKQRKAMFAAREGKSTLGIPKKVGEGFVGKDCDATDAGPGGGANTTDTIRSENQTGKVALKEAKDGGPGSGQKGHGGSFVPHKEYDSPDYSEEPQKGVIKESFKKKHP